MPAEDLDRKRQSIIDVASSYRLELEARLDFDGDPRTLVGQCLTASRAIVRKLTDRGLAGQAVCCNYLHAEDHYPALAHEVDPSNWEENSDEESFDGTWKHWVVMCEGFLVDVTQDQFHSRENATPVVVCAPNEPEWSSYSIAHRARSFAPAPRR